MTDYFEIGTVLKPQGVRGEVKIEPYTDNIARLTQLKFVCFKSADKYVKQEIEKSRCDSKFLYIKFKNVEDRNEAERLRGKNLYIDRQNAAELTEGEYYIADLIGMKVLDENGVLLGELKEILQTGSKDIYVVELIKGGVLSFPSVEGVITHRDIKACEMRIDGKKIEEVGIYDI